jgi:hypothetical protein
VIVLFFIVVGVNFYPSQSTRNFEAATIQATDFEFSNMKLWAYDGMRFTIRETKGISSIYGNTLSERSSNSGALVSGTITNISNRELLLTSGRTSSLRKDSPLGVTMSANNEIKSHQTVLEIKETFFAYNNDGITGYYIQPNEEFDFKLISSIVKMGDTGNEQLEISWFVVDPETLEQKVTRIQLQFKQTGTSLIWGESEIYWRRQPLLRRQ